MPKKILVAILFVLLGLLKADATSYYVSPSGSNRNPGTILLPFQTINYALSKAKNPGDTVYLRVGTYREVATFPYSGTAIAPIVLTAYNGENAIISGTDIYNTLTWSPTAANTSIYQAPYTGNLFEQLFYKGKPMIQARWPNLPKDAKGEWNFWDSTMWASAGNGSAYGTVVDANLAKTGINVTGALAILNVNHQYYTWSRPVLSHTSGSPSFTYAQDLGTSIGTTLPYNDDKYYLVGKKEFLDATGEWYNDTINHILYFYPPDGQNPNLSGGIEIKTRNYSLQASNKKYITIQNLNFWGTAFQFNSLKTGCDNLIFKNNTVLYSSFTEYYNIPSGQFGDNYEDIFPIIYGNNCQIKGNTFAYGALSALLINGYDNLIENNIIHDFNYSSSLTTPLLQVSRTWDFYIGKAGRAIVRYNDLYNSGGVLITIGQSYNNVYYNHLYDAFMSCYGGNKDHSMFYTNCQTNTSSTLGTRFHHNWVHNGYSGTLSTYWGGGIAIRGDDRTAGLTVDHNVTWNLGSVGIQIKSPDTPTINQANLAINNTSFNNSYYNTKKSSIILESQTNNQNKYSSLYNNAGKGNYGGWNGVGFNYLTQKGNNYDNLSLPIEDTAIYDFRPKKASPLINSGLAITGITTDVTDGKPDIGAYEKGSATYFIPGFRSNKSSFPIVPNGAANVSLSRDQIMWKPAYNAVYNEIYFGNTLQNLTLQATTLVEQNVFTLPTLSTGTTYYWRVDAQMADSSVITGDVWTFTSAGSLPVQFINFSGFAKDKSNALKWETANQLNFKGFEVQRLSQTNTWETIGFVVSKGKGTTYSYVDNSPFRSSNYRLLIKDIDGTESFSKVIHINQTLNIIWNISPNPTNGIVNINLISNTGYSDKATLITVYDIKGIKITSTKTINNTASINMNKYSKGVYIISINNGKEIYNERIILE